MDFKKILTESRKQRNISVYRLADLSGVPKSTIFSYEQGVSPTIERADKILKALGKTMVIGEDKHE